MVKLKYILPIFLLYINTLYANTQKVYFYTLDNSINNYKSLKIAFEEYLANYGEFEFQAFSDKKSFEQKLEKEDAIVILSSWHYDNIFKSYNLKAKHVAIKSNSIFSSKVLVGRKDAKLNGSLASCYDEEYTKKTLKNVDSKDLSLIKVPKEIDALMSVGFGISNFAIVSKDSFEAFSNANRSLSENMMIFKEFNATYKMVVAFKDKDKVDDSNELFLEIHISNKGKKILELLDIDGFIPLEKQHLKKLGGLK